MIDRVTGDTRWRIFRLIASARKLVILAKMQIYPSPPVTRHLARRPGNIGLLAGGT
jgi:hypothetical protein